VEFYDKVAKRVVGASLDFHNRERKAWGTERKKYREDQRESLGPTGGNRKGSVQRKRKYFLEIKTPKVGKKRSPTRRPKKKKKSSKTK